METLHLNIGRLFAQPYQSDYATARQFLVANPGLPLSWLESQLRVLKSKGSPVHRIQYLVGSTPAPGPHYPLTKAPLRQCQECSKILYHTDIFDFPWITHCPLHNRPLTSVCPSCRQAWPSIKEIASRKCALCGRPSINQIQWKKFKALTIKKCRSIKRLQGFAGLDNDQTPDLLGNLPHEANYSYLFVAQYKKVSVHSELYPACQLVRYPNLIKGGFKSHGIKNVPVRIRSGHCAKVQLQPPPPPIQNIKLAVSRYPKWMLYSDFTVMSRILRWIARHAEDGHVPYASNYRYMGLHHLNKSPPPCPFCIALSIWFFNTAISKYGQAHRARLNNYPFLAERGLGRILTPCEPLFLYEGFYHRPDRDFCRWFYEHNLELAFLQLFLHVEEVVKNIYPLTSRQKRASPPPAPGYPKSFPFYALIRRKNLHFCFAKSFSLNKLYPVYEVNNQCQKFQSHLQNVSRTKAKLKIMISKKNFNYTGFLLLQQQFEELINRDFMLYGVGSSPFI